MFKVMHGVDSVTPARDMAEVAAVVVRLMSRKAVNILIVREETPVTFTVDWSDKRDGRIGTMILHVGMMPEDRGHNG
jgi:hypothetical protein